MSRVAGVSDSSAETDERVAKGVAIDRINIARRLVAINLPFFIFFTEKSYGNRSNKKTVSKNLEHHLLRVLENSNFT